MLFSARVIGGYIIMFSSQVCITEIAFHTINLQLEYNESLEMIWYSLGKSLYRALMETHKWPRH